MPNYPMIPYQEIVVAGAAPTAALPWTAFTSVDGPGWYQLLSSIIVRTAVNTAAANLTLQLGDIALPIGPANLVGINATQAFGAFQEVLWFPAVLRPFHLATGVGAIALNPNVYGAVPPPLDIFTITLRIHRVL